MLLQCRRASYPKTEIQFLEIKALKLKFFPDQQLESLLSESWMHHNQISAVEV